MSENQTIIVDEKTGQIIPSEAMGMSLARPPAMVLAEAQEAATALQQVIAGKKDPVKFNGQQYLEFEDWQTVARFYGVTAKIISTQFVDYGGVQGFEARAIAVDKNGREISGAESMCLNDEEKWSSRPKYESLYVLKDGTKQKEDPPKDKIVWIDNPKQAGKKMPKRERILIGEEKVPLFQLRSMAQTRACAKVLRNVVAWVVVLAGYKPTPAEEMDGVIHKAESPVRSSEAKPPENPKPEGSQGSPGADPRPAKAAEPDPSLISEAGRKHIFELLAKHKVDPNGFRDWLRMEYRIESTDKIPKTEYEQICKWISNDSGVGF